MSARTVTVVGPGRMGSLLAVACSRAGRRVTVAGGGPAARAALHERVPGARLADDVSAAAAGAELVVVATPDATIEAVITDLVLAGALTEGQHVVHVAGSFGTAVLRRAALAGARVAACHPAMTVAAGTYDPDVLVGVPWAVTAAAPDRAWSHALVAELGGDAFEVPEDRRVLYHAALTVGSNAVAAATAVARALLLGAGIDGPARFLGPLVERSAGNVLRDGAAAITGPVVRGDVATVAAHLAALDADVPRLATAYRELTRAILEVVRPGLDAAAAAAIGAALEPPTS